MATKIVMVIGATGLVGEAVLGKLCHDPNIAEIRCLIRRPCKNLFTDKCQVHVVNFMDLDRSRHLFENVTDVICCVGTTMRKAKTKEAFQMVDHYIPNVVARFAKDQGVLSYSLVSSLGASSDSNSFYLNVKGRVEESIQSFGFNRCVIYRPSLLLGKRKEFRPMEWVMGVFFKLFIWLIPQKYHPTRVSILANRIVNDIHQLNNGIHIVESAVIH